MRNTKILAVLVVGVISALPSVGLGQPGKNAKPFEEIWNAIAEIWSELYEVNVSTGELVKVGDINGPFITSLSHNQADGNLYGLAVYGTGPWDSPYKSHAVKINPQNGNMDVLFETPYHSILGFARKPGGNPGIYYAWVNWTSHFYGEVNINAQTVTSLENADPVGVISAMAYKNFPVASIPSPAENPMSFELTGQVREVWDSDNLLNGAIHAGDRFSLRFSYDINAPYKYPSPNLSAPYGISVTINNLVFASEGIQTGIKNNYYDYMSDEVSDQFWISSVEGNTSFPIPMHDESIAWRLTDYTGTALFNNNVLPADFSLSAWDENRFYIFGATDDPEPPFYYISGVVDNSSNGDGGGAGGCFIATAGQGT